MLRIYLSRCLFLVGVLPSCFINGNGQALGEARDNGNGNGTGNASGNGTGNASGNGTGNGSGNTITVGKNGTSGNGTWDITTGGGGAINPSEMVIVGSHATGFVALQSEGKPEPGTSTCVRIKDRGEFQLLAEADSLSGTFTSIREWSGNGCPATRRSTLVVTGRRSQAGKNDLDGEWNIICADDETFTAVIQLSAADGIMTAISTRPELSFAARKR